MDCGIETDPGDGQVLMPGRSAALVVGLVLAHGLGAELNPGGLPSQLGAAPPAVGVGHLDATDDDLARLVGADPEQQLIDPGHPRALSRLAIRTEAGQVPASAGT